MTTKKPDPSGAKPERPHEPTAGPDRVGRPADPPAPGAEPVGGKPSGEARPAGSGATGHSASKGAPAEAGAGGADAAVEQALPTPTPAGDQPAGSSAPEGTAATDPATGEPGAADPTAESAEKPFHFTDKRKVTPEGVIRPGTSTPEADLLAGLDFEPSGEASGDAALLAAKSEAAEHLDALQRERASFTNYRKRSLRDQEAARTRGIEDVLTTLLPVLDDIDRARSHGELSGPFAAISDKLDAALGKFGIVRYGLVGEEFDPTVHDALMHQADPEATTTTVNIVIEPGYRIGERIVRAARVSVVGPQ